LSSVAFPSISTGIYGYPVEEAATVALGAVVEFLKEEERAPLLVRFVLFDEKTFQAYREALEAL
jgi:O-acetyl-ADP-ribose deacetylase (regulator of RNase III)